MEGNQMTRDEVIRLAKEAGISKPWDQEPVKWETLERFANLIVAAERQRKAWDATYWTAYEQDVAEAERESCAKMLAEEGWLMAATLVRVKK
jgi:hypothetical protein